MESPSVITFHELPCQSVGHKDPRVDRYFTNGVLPFATPWWKAHIFSPAAFALPRNWSLKAWPGPNTPTVTLKSAITIVRELRRRSGGLSMEHRVDCGLGAFFTVATGDAHRADDLAVEHDWKRAGLRKIVHEGRRQILAAADHFVGFRSGAAPSQG